MDKYFTFLKEQKQITLQGMNYTHKSSAYMTFKSITKYTQKSLCGIFFSFQNVEDKAKAARETIRVQMSYDLA